MEVVAVSYRLWIGWLMEELMISKLNVVPRLICGKCSGQFGLWTQAGLNSESRMTFEIN